MFRNSTWNRWARSALICGSTISSLKKITGNLRRWARDPGTGREVKYGDVRLADEQQFSVYNFELADVQSTWRHFELCEAECKKLIERYAVLSKDKSEGDGIAREKARFPLLGAYDLCLKCSHYFNILDARGAISVKERVGVIARVRALAVGIAKAWTDQQHATEKKSDNSGDAKPSAKNKREKKGNLAPVG